MWVSEEEQVILKYLKDLRGVGATAREIARKAWTKDKWKENERWAQPHLSRLKEKKLIETDAGGAYRIFGAEKEERP
jgi:uncharacterized protein YjhX (UPF0386 family)